METLLRTKPISEDNELPPLKIRFQFVDGSEANFFQPEPVIAENIWSRINVAHLFMRPRIVIADDYSKSVYGLQNATNLALNLDGTYAASDTFTECARAWMSAPNASIRSQTYFTARPVSSDAPHTAISSS